jgi:hypothetical protein
MAPLGEEVVYQRLAGIDVSPGSTLCAPDPLLLRRNPQFLVFDAQQDLIANVDAEGLAERSRDYDSAIFVYSRFRLGLHDSMFP